MNVKLSHQVLEIFPEASIHGIVVDGLQSLIAAAVEPWRNRAKQEVAQRQINPEFLIKETEIQEWRNAFQKFGIKPSKQLSSIEALEKRAVKGHFVQTRIPAVNLYCDLSVIARVPMGAYDLGKVQGDIAVRLAEEGEVFLAIGEKVRWSAKAGMVVYSDETGLICWAWNHRDSLRTCLDQQTQKAIFFADSSIRASRQQAMSAIALLGEALAGYCTIQATFMIDAANPEAQLF